MMRTCNGLELRDQIPPLPPEVTMPASFDPMVLLDHQLLNMRDRYALLRVIADCMMMKVYYVRINELITRAYIMVAKL